MIKTIAKIVDDLNDISWDLRESVIAGVVPSNELEEIYEMEKYIGDAIEALDKVMEIHGDEEE